jgi:ribosomal-protein-serine acetyltransferase
MLIARIGDDAELRLLEERHAAALFALIDGSRDHLRRWLPWVDGNRSVAQARAFIQATLRQYAANDGYHAGIWTGGELAGVVGHHRIDWDSRATSLGYWLGTGFQGRGLMTGAVRAVVDRAFDELRLNRIEIHCAVENRRSRAIPERLGFREEGRLRQAEWLNDHFVDHVLYAVLAAEWPAAPAATRNAPS